MSTNKSLTQLFHSLYHEVELKQRAFEYLYENNLRCGYDMSRLITQQFKLENGVVTTFFPKNATEQELYNFASGQAIESTWDLLKDVEMTAFGPLLPLWMGPLIQDFLNRGEHYFYLMEDNEARSSDRGLKDIRKKSPAHILTFDDKVYHLVHGQNKTIQEINMAMSGAESWVFIGILTRVENQIFLPKTKTTLDVKELDILVNGTQKIVVAAYDHSGFLMWHRSRPSLGRNSPQQFGFLRGTRSLLPMNLLAPVRSSSRCTRLRWNGWRRRRWGK